jgi:hypothetical protein
MHSGDLSGIASTPTGQAKRSRGRAPKPSASIEGARWRQGDLCLQGVERDALDVRRIFAAIALLHFLSGSEYVLALVDPWRLAWRDSEKAHGGASDMPRAVQLRGKQGFWAHQPVRVC